MHVVVLGAGVIGVTTAYYLSELGHEVTIIDQAREIASGASGGNGGQLSYSFTDAMATPALLAKMPGMLAGLNPAFHVRPAITPQFLRWGLSFLSQCSMAKNRKNTSAILELALKSGALMRDLNQRTGFEFCYRRAGKLVLQDTASAMSGAETACVLKREQGCDARVISIDEAMEIEPALKEWTGNYAGAVYSESDEVGDPLAFSTQLLQWLQSRRGTGIKLNTSVNRIVARQGRLAAVETDRGDLQPDAVVVCLGAESNQLLHPLGVKTNIYPMRGYSVTLPSLETSNSVSITDPGSKTVFSRLGDEVRIAGFADFVGFRTGKDAVRTETLVHTARATAPAIADFTSQSKSEWGGFRPMTPDSRPLLGPTAIKGIHLNTGHGMLGWTLACVSGHVVASGIQS
jgi:D-amino-acid dehydrogenase